MTSIPVRYDELLAAREKLISTIKKDITDSERKFLISLKEMAPQWNLLDLEGIEKFPSIQWKLLNLQKMSAKKHAESLIKLKSKLGL